MNTSDILKMYEKGIARYEIAELIVREDIVEDFTEALQVVEDVILQAKNMKRSV